MGQVMLVPPQQEEALPFVAAPSEPPMAAAPAGELPQALPYEAAHRSLGASFMAAMMRSGWTPKS